MSDVLQKLKPYEVFKYFEEMSQIPRGSGNEKGISDYLVAFAKEHNLHVVQDSALNVIIKKPATVGYENAPIVIIQGHSDMVCEKNIGTEHNFEKDPLKLRIVDDMIYASGTTLGADNGIAVAFGLAILASKDLQHPAIELLVTSEEETGMGGAVALDPKNVDGRILINIDSEEEGKLLVSCSGGVRAQVSLDIKYEEACAEKKPYAIRIRGLKGGHSGMEINKGRGNANKIMGRILMDLASSAEFDLSSLNGGSKMNAIPREMDATIFIKPDSVELVKGKIEEWNQILQNELRTPDPEVKVLFEALNTNFPRVFSKETKDKALKILFTMPNGIQTMSMDIAGIVESSTNLGVVLTSESKIEFDSAVRSSVKSLKYAITSQIKVLAETMGAQLMTQSDYPEWQYDPSSKVRKVFEKVYQDIYKVKPEIVAIHAGVECGLFKEKFGEIDMISFGPNLYDVHTPDEHMNIHSVQRSWDYLVAVLKDMK